MLTTVRHDHSALHLFDICYCIQVHACDLCSKVLGAKYTRSSHPIYQSQELWHVALGEVGVVICKPIIRYYRNHCKPQTEVKRMCQSTRERVDCTPYRIKTHSANFKACERHLNTVIMANMHNNIRSKVGRLYNLGRLSQEANSPYSSACCHAEGFDIWSPFAGRRLTVTMVTLQRLMPAEAAALSACPEGSFFPICTGRCSLCSVGRARLCIKTIDMIKAAKKKTPVYWLYIYTHTHTVHIFFFIFNWIFQEPTSWVQ